MANTIPADEVVLEADVLARWPHMTNRQTLKSRPRLGTKHGCLRNGKHQTLPSRSF